MTPASTYCAKDDKGTVAQPTSGIFKAVVISLQANFYLANICGYPLVEDAGKCAVTCYPKNENGRH
uniref:Uncharacterized protein n=1 Tax=Romanomermis culicivorax TaxID=13658 RepID=A0A915JJA8_ROMCU